jgi:hypothetical protein
LFFNKLESISGEQASSTREQIIQIVFSLLFWVPSSAVPARNGMPLYNPVKRNACDISTVL